MKDFHAGGSSIVALICVTSFLLMVSAGQSLAQRGSPGAAAAGRRTDTLNRQGEQYERDNLGRESEGPADAAGARRRAQAVAEQVKRDFENLQDSYNKIVLAMAPEGHPDLDSILESVAEVGKSATRLRNNLALPKAGPDEGDKARGEVSAAKVEESLLELRKHIYNFVTNPLFEGSRVLDVGQARKAGRDLDMILKLSEGLRRSSGRPKGRPE